MNQEIQRPSPERSRNMAAIRTRDTRIEVTVRRALFARGFRYRIGPKELPGKPDIVLPKYRAVVFVHGCFWHGHDCSLFKAPATNSGFWQEKIGKNRERDDRDVRRLQEMGWRIATVWECALRGKDRLGIIPVADSLEEWLLGTKTREVLHEKGASVTAVR